MKNYFINWLVILSIFLYNCNKYELDFNKFNSYKPTVEFVVPLAYSNLKIANLVENYKNDSYIDRSNLIHVLLRNDSTFEYTNDKTTEIKPQTLNSLDTNIGFIKISESNLYDKIKLNSILLDFNSTNQNILNNLNNTTNFFPEILDSTKTIKNFRTIDNFSFIFIKSGKINFKITNYLPTIIDTLIFDIYSGTDHKTLFSSIILNNIEPKNNKNVLLNFKEGTLLNNLISYKIRKIKISPSPNKVPISLNDSFVIDFSIFDLKIGAGLAKLPSQSVHTITRNAILSSSSVEKFFNLAFDTAETFLNGGSTINFPLEIKINFLKATKNGTVFPEQTIKLPSQPKFNIKAIDFSKVRFSFDDNNPTKANAIDFEVKINIVGSDINYYSFDSSQGIKFDLALSKAKLLYVVGIIKDTTSTYITKEINNIDLKNISSGLNFDSSSLTINCSNSIGLPLIVDFNIVGYNNDRSMIVTNKLSPFQVNAPPVPIDVTPMNYNNLTFVPTTTKFSNYGKNRGNINEIVSLPTASGFITAIVNINTEYNTPSFSSTLQKLYIDTELDIPLILKAKNVELSDTIEFDSKNFENIDSLLLGLKIENGFPFKTDLKILFINDAKKIIDSSIINQVLLPSTIDINGRTIAPTISQSSFTLSKYQINNLINQNANKIILKATVFTPKDGTSQIKIYNDYSMNVKFGIVSKIKLSK